MHIIFPISAFLITTAAIAAEPFVYPETKRIDHTDTYHGTVVADPYRWLEEIYNQIHSDRAGS